jgi:hypothetical protein
MRGLAAGRSFVTTGPMIFAKVDGQWPGTNLSSATSRVHQLDCTVRSEQPLESIELIVNGAVAQAFQPENKKTVVGSFESRFSSSFQPETSSWLAWRCFEKRAGGRTRFAHTAPWHFDIPSRPLRPRRAEADWLISRVKEEITRSRGVAPENLINDYHRALALYEEIAKNAR